MGLNKGRSTAHQGRPYLPLPYTLDIGSSLPRTVIFGRLQNFVVVTFTKLTILRGQSRYLIASSKDETTRRINYSIIYIILGWYNI